MLTSTSRIGLSRNAYSIARISNRTIQNSSKKVIVSSISSRSLSSCSIPLRSFSSSSTLNSHPIRSSPSHLRGHGLHRGAIALTSLVQPMMKVNQQSSRNLSLWPSSSSKTQDATSASASSTIEQSQSHSESAAAMALPPSTPGESVSIESDLSSSSSSNPIESFSLPNGQQVSDSLSSSTSETMNELASYGLGHASDSYFNIRYAEIALDWLVNTTGLPWWAVIASLTVAIRVAVAPILVWSQANSIRMNNIQPKMQEGMKDLQRAKALGDQAEMAEAAGKVRKLMKDNDVSVIRGFVVPLIQMPLFITFFFALRAIANAGLPSLKEGGFGWVTDLAAADPYYILPCLSAALTLGVIESGAETGGGQNNMGPQQKMMKNVLRVLTVGVIPFIANFPAAVFVFWSVNNGFSLLQLLALQTEWLKTKLRLPKKIIHKPTGSEPQTFMEQIRSQMAEKSDTQPSSTTATVLPNRRQVDSSREGAMRELLQDKSRPSNLVKPTSSNKKSSNHNHKSKKSNSNLGQQQLERQIRENAREEKRRRVEAARERR